MNDNIYYIDFHDHEIASGISFRADTIREKSDGNREESDSFVSNALEAQQLRWFISSIGFDPPIGIYCKASIYGAQLGDEVISIVKLSNTCDQSPINFLPSTISDLDLKNIPMPFRIVCKRKRCQKNHSHSSIDEVAKEIQGSKFIDVMVYRKRNPDLVRGCYITVIVQETSEFTGTHDPCAERIVLADEMLGECLSMNFSMKDSAVQKVAKDMLFALIRKEYLMRYGLSWENTPQDSPVATKRSPLDPGKMSYFVSRQICGSEWQELINQAVQVSNLKLTNPDSKISNPSYSFFLYREDQEDEQNEFDLSSHLVVRANETFTKLAFCDPEAQKVDVIVHKNCLLPEQINQITELAIKEFDLYLKINRRNIRPLCDVNKVTIQNSSLLTLAPSASWFSKHFNQKNKQKIQEIVKNHEPCNCARNLKFRCLLCDKCIEYHCHCREKQFEDTNDIDKFLIPSKLKFQTSDSKELLKNDLGPPPQFLLKWIHKVASTQIERNPSLSAKFDPSALVAVGILVEELTRKMVQPVVCGSKQIRQFKKEELNRDMMIQVRRPSSLDLPTKCLTEKEMISRLKVIYGTIEKNELELIHTSMSRVCDESRIPLTLSEEETEVSSTPD